MLLSPCESSRPQYAPYPILLRMAKIMLSYYLGHRESQGRYLTARAEVLTVAW